MKKRILAIQHHFLFHKFLLWKIKKKEGKFKKKGINETGNVNTLHNLKEYLCRFE